MKPTKTSYLPTQVDSWPFVEDGGTAQVPPEFEQLVSDDKPLFGLSASGTLVLHPEEPERPHDLPAGIMQDPQPDPFITRES